MIYGLLAISGLTALFAARGFVISIRREPQTLPSLAEWALGAGVGVLAGAMLYALLRPVFGP